MKHNLRMVPRIWLLLLLAFRNQLIVAYHRKLELLKLPHSRPWCHSYSVAVVVPWHYIGFQHHIVAVVAGRRFVELGPSCAAVGSHKMGLTGTELGRIGRPSRG